MIPKRLRILRLVELNKLISADVFEQAFSKICVDWADICYENPHAWLSAIVEANDCGKGTALTKASMNFAERVSGYDYISPGYNGFHLLPLLALLRSAEDFKILFIAHAPLQHAVELSLVKDLLRAEDVIVCPSLNARKILCSFHAEFSRHIVVIPHAVEPLPRPESPSVSAIKSRKLVTLGRITEDKLIHRQIDAMAVLREQGIVDVVLEIGGPCLDDHGRTLRYVNELKARIRRLGLEKRVIFHGTVSSKQEKGTFFADAAVCLSLSRAEEESFGKSCAEAVALGVPVITTNWDGLPETVGKCGEILPLYQLEGRQIFDINPADCAQAIIKLLEEAPPQTEFVSQQQLFAPEARGVDYREALFNPANRAQRSSPNTAAAMDFFNQIPAIRAISFSEHKDMYLASLGIRSENILSKKEFKRAAERWELLADLIFQSVRAGGKQLLARQCVPAPVPAIAGIFKEKLDAYPVPVDEDMHRRLIADCLLECDSWARELTLTRLTVQSPFLSAWLLELLEDQNCSTGFFLLAEVNKILASGDAVGAAQCIQQHLAGRQLLENDAALMLYFLQICQQADSVPIMTEILEQWLMRYPDAPQCSVLWPVLASTLIIHEEHYDRGHEALAQVETIIPDFDTTNLRAALIVMEHV